MNLKQHLLLGISVCSFGVFATEMATIPSQKISDSSSVTKNSCGLQTQDACLFVISNRHVNRIVTPFNNPSIKMDNIGGVSYKAKANVLYLSTTSDQPIAGFITETGDESSAIKVVFKPMSMSPQEIILGHTTAGSAIARKFERANPRDTTIQTVLSTLAKQNLPAGYQIGPVNSSYIPECNQDGLLFDFFKGQFVSGGDYVASIGTVTNTSNQIKEFTENNCYKDGVIAVAAYPTQVLLPNEKSEVYVMYYRDKPVVTSTPSRKSLLEN